MQTLTATESEAVKGGMTYDLNPVIFIRASKPLANLFDKMDTICLTDFF